VNPALELTLENMRPAGESWYLRGHVVFECLAGLQATGVLAELASGGSVAADETVAGLGLDGRILSAVLRYLYGAGLMDRDGRGRYRLAFPISKADLAKIEIFRAYAPVFSQLAALLSGHKRYGNGISRIPDLDATASSSIGEQFCYPFVIETVRSLGAGCVLDVGCGSGDLLIQACRTTPGLTGCGFDCAPTVVTLANQRIRHAGLSDRIRVVQGDLLMIDQVLGGPKLSDLRSRIDVIVSTSVLHEFAFPDEQALIPVLRRLKANLPSVPLVLFEVIEHSDEELRLNPSPALEHHLFHRLSMQGIASVDSWKTAFVASGYTLGQEVYTDTRGVLFLLQ
jgi:SAM-dependent methyltransferase